MAKQKQDDQLEHTYSSYIRDTGCSPEDLPEVMNDRENWWARVRDIRASRHDMMMMRPIDRTLSGGTTQSQSRPGSDDDEGVIRTPQRSTITGTSATNCFVTYLGHSYKRGLPLCREAVVELYIPSRPGNNTPLS